MKACFRNHVESIFPRSNHPLPFRWFVRLHACACACLPISVCFRFWLVRGEYGWRHLKNGLFEYLLRLCGENGPNRSEWYTTYDMRAACYNFVINWCVVFLVARMLGALVVLLTFWCTLYLGHTHTHTKDACHRYMKQRYRQFARIMMERLLFPAIK